MTKRILVIFLLSLPTFVFSQVGIGTNSPVASAQLDVSSTTKGFLPPRMTNAQRSAIGSPTAGLMVYQTDATAGLYYYTGSAWIYIINATTNVLPVANGGTGVTTSTGTGNVVLSTSPSLTTPSIGSGGFTLAGSTSGTTNVVTSAAASGTVTIPAGTATLATTSNELSAFATSTSSELAGVISDETGSGSLVFGTSPSLTTPSLGAATATSINKVAITAPTSSATLTIADGKTLTASNSITMAGTDGTTMTFPSTSATMARTDAAQTFTGTQTFSGLKLTTAAASGKILTSDASGNASWQTGAVAIYTEVHCGINNSSGYVAGAAFNDFSTITADNVVALYGTNYGFFDGTGTGSSGDKWVAPFTGKFRITTNAYFNYNSSYNNPRLYAYKNNNEVCNVTSANNTSADIATSTSAIISMNQGDYINWKVQGSGAQIWRGLYHTFFRIESVE